MPPKKRYSAFEDLNANGVEKPKIQPPATTKPEDSVAVQVERIEADD